MNHFYSTPIINLVNYSSFFDSSGDPNSQLTRSCFFLPRYVTVHADPHETRTVRWRTSVGHMFSNTGVASQIHLKIAWMAHGLFKKYTLSGKEELVKSILLDDIFVPHHIISYHIIFYDLAFYHTKLYHIMSNDITSYHILVYETILSNRIGNPLIEKCQGTDLL